MRKIEPWRYFGAAALCVAAYYFGGVKLFLIALIGGLALAFFTQRKS